MPHTKEKPYQSDPFDKPLILRIHNLCIKTYEDVPL